MKGHESAPLWKSTVSSCAAEFMCAVAWPLNLCFYSWLPRHSQVYVVGGLVVWPVISTIIIMLAPRNNPPRISSSAIFMEMIHDNTHRLRHVEQESTELGILRLCLHWLGGFIGYFLLNMVVDREYVEDRLNLIVWEPFGRNFNQYAILGLHVGVLGIMGAAWLRSAQSPRRIHQERRSRLLIAIETYAWTACLLFPWGGPSFSIGSYLWVANAFGLPSVSVLLAMGVVSITGAIVAIFLCELSYGTGSDADVDIALSNPRGLRKGKLN